MALITLKRGSEKRILAGHPWIYAGQVARLRGELADGDPVDVEDWRGRFLGRGLVNRKSQIVVRLFTRQQEELDETFFREHLRQAVEYRRKIVGGTNAYRLVYSEGDFLPGLIVDRYADILVIQTLTVGMDQRKAMIARILQAMLAPQGIYERNDVKVRELEGLPQAKGLLVGEVPRFVEIEEHGVRYRVDVHEGQKTGFFLDQRENRARLADYVQGARVLDAFCYSGGFGIAAAKSGAADVIGIDVSEDAVKLGEENAALNGVSERVRFEVANAFDRLKELDIAGERFDVVILDPPAFAKSKDALPGALRGYKEINLRAMKILRPGGVLITCSCSHHMSEELFRETLLEAAVDARRHARLLEIRTQDRDHPILLAASETQYLKCFVVEVK